MLWDAVDFEAGTITIRQSRVAVKGGTSIGKPKSSKSARVIRPDDVLPGTMAALKRLKISSTPSTTGLVLVDGFGEPVGPQVLSSRFKTLARKAKVPTIKVHSTRHTCAYLMHIAGVPAVNAAKYLGHVLPVYLSIYVFATDDGMQAAAVRLGEVLAAAGAQV